MLGGMAGLPGTEWDKRNPSPVKPPCSGNWVVLNQPVEHVFTHFRLTLTVERLIIAEGQPEGEGQWWPIWRIGDAGLPTLFAKVARTVMKVGDD